MILNAVQINNEFFVLTTDGLRGFFRPNLVIAVAKKTYIKDKAEGSWLRKGKVRSIDVAQKEESEGLRSTRSQEDQHITEYNR